MGVRILSDVQRDYTMTSMAALYCSTTEIAFGPVILGDDDHDAHERAEAFCRWLGTRDPRSMTEPELLAAFSDWLAQEAAQWQAEAEEVDV